MSYESDVRMRAMGGMEVIRQRRAIQDSVGRWAQRAGKEIERLAEVPAGALESTDTYYTMHTHRLGQCVGKSLGCVFVRWFDQRPPDDERGNPASTLHPDVRVLKVLR